VSCERYWSEGVVLVEQGQADPHRDTCGDCQRAHASRVELVGVLPLVHAMRTGNPRWKERVWRQIDGRATVQRAWWIGGGLVVAAAAASLVLWLATREHAGPGPVVAARPEIEIVSGQVAMRSKSARVGDRVRVNVTHGEEVRFYRAEQLLARCAAAAVECELELASAGEYQVVIVTPPAPAPEVAGTLDGDLAAVVSAGGRYRITPLSVR